MFVEIKKKINEKLPRFLSALEKKYALNKISPLLFRSIREFTSRPGKRIRPTLFIIGYKGFKEKEAKGLYTSALSLELLHDFMLIHDDIIDKSELRRGKPSLHTAFNRYLSRYRNLKFNGQDLSLVAGDLMYAMSIRAFLEIKEEPRRKETALRKFIEAALYTGSGEFIELIYGIEPLEKIDKDDIYRIYDFKTACYTFATPLATGAILAGAEKNDTDKLFNYGIYLGRAFQIKDDILGLLGDEKQTGKSALTDLKEQKKTILIWHAYKDADRKDKLIIKKVMSKDKPGKKDLIKLRTIIRHNRTVEFARREISFFIKKAENCLIDTAVRPPYKQSLHHYAQEILKFEL